MIPTLVVKKKVEARVLSGQHSGEEGMITRRPTATGYPIKGERITRKRFMEEKGGKREEDKITSPARLGRVYMPLARALAEQSRLRQECVIAKTARHNQYTTRGR